MPALQPSAFRADCKAGFYAVYISSVTPKASNTVSAALIKKKIWC